MSHDFAKNSSGSSKKKPAKKTQNASKKVPEKKNLPGWFFFLCGVAFTLFAQFLYHLAKIQTAPTESQVASKKEVAKPATKPVYDFYEKLKTMEVDVPDEVVEKREQENYNYVLQAGSFKNISDANQQRAEIILLGLDATIETTKNQSGNTWHRIIVGPFTSRSKLNKARSTLINSGMETMTIKRGD